MECVYCQNRWVFLFVFQLEQMRGLSHGTFAWHLSISKLRHGISHTMYMFYFIYKIKISVKLYMKVLHVCAKKLLVIPAPKIASSFHGNSLLTADATSGGMGLEGRTVQPGRTRQPSRSNSTWGTLKAGFSSPFTLHYVDSFLRKLK